MGRRSARIPTLLLLMAAAPRAHAIEIAAAAGSTNLASAASYSWQLEYRERLFPTAGLSFAYLNEGHLRHHHRDGGAFEAWADTPPWHDRLRLSIGAGPYLFCDTRMLSGALAFRDDHGVAGIVTASMTWYLQPHWFTRFSLNEVRASGDIDSTSIEIGFGYREDASFEPHESDTGGPEDEDTGSPRNELGAFVGQTVLNTASSPKSAAFGLEYRRLLGRHTQVSGAWLSEADALHGRHSGLVGELWLVQPFLGDEASVGIGAGPYGALQPYRALDQQPGARWVGVGSITASWRIARAIVARVEWHRGFTRDDQDRDIVTLGVAWAGGR